MLRIPPRSKLKTGRGSSLYEFWGDIITKQLDKDAKVIINIKHMITRLNDNNTIYYDSSNIT